MGRVKSGILEKISEGENLGKEAIDRGNEIKSEGTEIKSLIDSIDTSIDEDDMGQVENISDNYQEDFNDTFDSDVETKVSEADGVYKEATDTASEEKDKVDDAADTFRQMEGASDIGRSNASAGADAMGQSSQEYADNITEAEQQMEQLDSEKDSLKGDVEGLFG